jgi:hypothetical protein
MQLCMMNIKQDLIMAQDSSLSDGIPATPPVTISWTDYTTEWGTTEETRDHSVSIPCRMVFCYVTMMVVKASLEEIC